MNRQIVHREKLKWTNHSTRTDNGCEEDIFKMKRTISVLSAAVIFMSMLVMPANVSARETNGDKPWMNTKLSAEERVELLLDAMTLEQKIQ